MVARAFLSGCYAVTMVIWEVSKILIGGMALLGGFEVLLVGCYIAWHCLVGSRVFWWFLGCCLPVGVARWELGCFVKCL